MSPSSKVSIVVGAIHIEGDPIAVALGEHLKKNFKRSLRKIRDELNSQGIETTVTIEGVTLDEDELPTDETST